MGRPKIILKRKQHNELKDIRLLVRKHDVLEINPAEGRIIIRVGKYSKKDLGNKSWGRIDFLVGSCGYYLLKTN